MNEQHREVQVWLEQLYGGEAVPSYEISPRTIDLLHQLMLQSTAQEEDAAACVNQYRQMAEEYSLQGVRIANILQQLGLNMDSLSQSGSMSVRSLSSVALLLQVKDASNSSLLLALSDLSNDQMRVSSEQRNEERFTEALFRKTKAALLKANTLNKVYEKLESQLQHQGPELVRKAKQAGFLQSKAKEYKKHIKQLQVEQVTAGADETIYHHTLTKKAQELEELKERLNPLKAKLDSYHKLPADLSLAKVQVEGAKQELAALEGELAKHIDLMHL